MKNHIFYLAALFAVSFFINGCIKDDTTGSVGSIYAYTDSVYVINDTALTNSYGTYRFYTGPINVSKYSKIRVNTSERLSGVAFVIIQITDRTGMAGYGILDSYYLDSNISNGSLTSRVYEVPGEYITVNFSSTDSLLVDVAIFGR